MVLYRKCYCGVGVRCVVGEVVGQGGYLLFACCPGEGKGQAAGVWCRKAAAGNVRHTVSTATRVVPQSFVRKEWRETRTPWRPSFQ